MYILFFYLLTVLSLFSQDFSADGKFPYPLNTQNSEYSPVIAPNSRYIVFQSNRPGGMGGMDIWISENKNFRNRTGVPSWGEPQNFRELNSPDFEGPFSILFDSEGRPSEIFFTAQKSNLSGRDGLKGLNIYYTRNLSGKNPASDKWSIPEHILEINSNFDDKMPSISPDGKTIIFSSNRPGGYGGFDLWVSNRDKRQNKWSTPVNMGGAVNSSGNEIMPSYHFDGTSLFFSSDRKDDNYKYSFYTVEFEDDSLVSAEDGVERSKKDNMPPSMPKVRELKKMNSPFNSKYDDEGMTISHDGMWVYFSSNRPGGEGQFDIYRAPVTEDMRKSYAFDLMGLVVDGSESTMIGLDSSIKIYNEKGLVRLLTSKRIGGDITNYRPEGENSNFKTKLLTNYKYKIEVSSPGFYPNEFSLDLTGNIGFGKSKFVKVILMPQKDEEPVVEEPVVVKPPEKKAEKVEPAVNPPKPKEKEQPLVASTSAIVEIKDFDSKRVIIEGSVKLFSDTQKEGFLLQKGKDSFILDKIPQGAFELTATAPGYSTETLIVGADDKALHDKKSFEILLKKSKASDGIFDKIILFDFSDSKIKADQMPHLEEVIKHLQANIKDRIEVAGHTDNIDSKDFNVKLSQKRADVIKEFFISKGIDEKRIETKALWYSQPVSDNDTEEGRAKNRRVTFKKLSKKQ